MSFSAPQTHWGLPTLCRVISGLPDFVQVMTLNIAEK